MNIEAKAGEVRGMDNEAMLDTAFLYGANAAYIEQLQARYAANRLRVVRQVHYSVHHENSIDLVLFLNGLPVVMVELKNPGDESADLWAAFNQLQAYKEDG